VSSQHNPCGRINQCRRDRRCWISGAFLKVRNTNRENLQSHSASERMQQEIFFHTSRTRLVPLKDVRAPHRRIITLIYKLADSTFRRSFSCLAYILNQGCSSN